MTLDFRTSEWYICKGITRFRKTTVRWLEQPPHGWWLLKLIVLVQII